jgi:hypothetical protein
MTRVAVVINPNASRLRRDSRLVERSRSVAGKATVVVTRTTAELDEVAERLMGEGVRTVVLAGGDGSYMAGVTAFFRAAAGRPLPRFVLAPGGTVATVARNWGQRAGLLSTVRSACAAPEDLETVRRPTLSVSEEGGAERIGFTVGTGLVARFFDKYYTSGAGGYGPALRIVVRIFAGSFVGSAYARDVLTPMPARLIVDGRELSPKAWSLVVCSVLSDLGVRTRVTYRGGEDPERPHLVASPLPPRRLGPQWPRVVLGRRLHGDGNYDGLIEQFDVVFSDGPGAYVLDGDVLRAKAITVRAGPQIEVAAL